MPAESISAARLRGLSFSIADLTLINAWSQARDLRLVVRLDHGSETEEYEEVLTCHTGAGRPCQWIIWRDADAVFVQPLIGRAQRYPSVAAAIDAIAPPRSETLTDIRPSRWLR